MIRWHARCKRIATAYQQLVALEQETHMDIQMTHLLGTQLFVRLGLLLPFLAAFLALPIGARADIKSQTIEYKDGDLTCKGFIAYPAILPKPGPAILIFPEWWGQTDYPRSRAQQLAALGYVAFCADMYGNDKTADDAAGATTLSRPFYTDRNLMRTRAAAALSALVSNTVAPVDPAKVVAIGYCFGGTNALELGRSGADLAGIVAFHAGLSTPNPDDAKNIKGRVLALNGGDDAFVKPEERQAFEKEMRDAGVDWVMVDLGGAVHAFSNPEADKHNIPNIKYNEKADKRSFQMLKDFLTDLFGAPGT
jgi:dienelactone hydrolase